MTDTPSTAAPAIAMPPGRYLSLRREDAGLTIPHVATVLVPASRKNAASDRADYRRQIAKLEADKLQGAAQARLVDLLRAVFPFDHEIYWLLVGRAADPESEIPVPHICRGCGCTWNDPCQDGEHGCSWVEGDPGLCTVCERAGRGGPAPAPVPANDTEEAGHAS